MLFLYCGDMLKQEKYHKGVDFFEKAALSVEQECSFVKFSGIDDVTVRQEWGYAMEDTKRSNKKFHMNILYVAWLLGLFLFLLVMGNWYCVKVYGGNLLYIAFGKNEVSAEEKAFLKERGTLIYGETLDSFPAQIYDPTMESENGFAIDLMNQLAWEMDTTIEFQPVIWADSFTLLENGTVDMIQISYSEERAEKYYLSAPIYRSKGVVFLRDDGEEITRLQDLQGKTLAGIKSDYALTVLKEHYPELKILEYDSIGECAEQLKAQNVDGIVADEQNIMYYAQGEKMFQDYYILDEEVYTEDVVFAVRKEDAALGKIIDKAVYKLRTQDVLDRVQRKWFLTSILEDALPRQFIYVWLAVLLSGIAGFFVFLFWYIHKHTRILVEVRTKELNVERMRLKTVLDAIPQYLLEVTPEGQVQLMNQQAKKDMNQNALCRGDAAVITQPAILQMIKTAKNEAFAQQELEINQKIYRITCSDIGGLSENENVILLAEDVTLRRIQEKQNIQNNKMMAIGELASGISHELKNPLEIICNYCYALKKGILHTKEDCLQTICVIEEEAKEANKIVESLLSFARLSPTEIGEAELKASVQMILQLQMPLFHHKQIVVEFDCAEPVWVCCTQEGLKKIFINLFTNAMDAMEAVKDRQKKIRISVILTENFAIVEVADNGKGMKAEEKERIFNPFYTTKSTGTGLGLYLVYQQLEEVGGSIQVYSEEGQGTLFRVMLPLKKSLGE